MNVAIVTEAKPRLLLQHSRPDHEVSKPRSDSHPVSNLYIKHFDLAMTSLQNCPKASQL